MRLTKAFMGWTPEGRRAVALATGLSLLAVGLLLLGIAGVRFLVEGRGIGLVAPGCTLMAAGTASVVATLGIESWAEQRERDRETKEYEHREKTYEGIAAFMLAQFTAAHYDAARDAELRAVAALWASPTVVECLGNWRETTTRVIRNARAAADEGRADSMIPTGSEEDRVMRDFGLAITAMRQDLASDSTDPLDPVLVLKSVFNSDIPDDFYAKEDVRPSA